MTRRLKAPIVYLMLSLFVAMLLAACGKSQGEPGAAGGKSSTTLRIAMGVDVKTFDPHNYKSMIDLMVDDLLYDTLVAYDENMNIVPRLAKSWKNIDPTTWEFELRQDVKFSDGTTFNAQAVKVNYDRARVSPIGKGYYGIISEIQVISDYTVRFKTADPFGPFLTPLTIPNGGVISPAALEKQGDKITTNPVGSGPFKLAEYVPNDHITLVRNDDYWGPKPKLEKVIIRPIPDEASRMMTFEAGDVDVIRDFPPHKLADYKKDANLKAQVSPSMRLVWLGFNNGDSVLKDKRIRQAISLAVDTKSILQDVVEGIERAADSPAPPETIKKKVSFPHVYDPNRAKALLAEAGYPNGLSINLWTPQGRYLKDKEMSEVIQRQLAAVGITAKFDVMEWGAYSDAMFKHKQQLYVIGAGFPGGDATQVLQALFSSDSYYDHSNVQNPDLDKLFKEASRTIDQEARENLLATGMKTLMDDANLVPLYVTNELYAMKKGVEGFKVTPNELIDLRQTTVTLDK